MGNFVVGYGFSLQFSYLRTEGLEIKEVKNKEGSNMKIKGLAKLSFR